MNGYALRGSNFGYYGFASINNRGSTLKGKNLLLLEQILSV